MTQRRSGSAEGPMVGFDLDMTLVDSADGIAATFAEVSRRMGADVIAASVRELIGLPLEETCAALLGRERAAEAVVLYRELTPEYGVPRTTVLPGAAEAIRAVHKQGGQAVVISAKAEHLARATLDHVGLEVDDVVGSHYGTGKGVVLTELGAGIHVGDHPGDMLGAQSAGAIGVGVTTGSHDADALRAAGAQVVLAGLTDFPDWLAETTHEGS